MRGFFAVDAVRPPRRGARRALSCRLSGARHAGAQTHARPTWLLSAVPAAAGRAQRAPTRETLRPFPEGC